MSDVQAELIPGLETLPPAMQRFVSDAPQLWEPACERPMTYFAFDAGGGMSLISFDAGQLTGDAQMDFVANSVIRYVRDYRPIGLVGLCEGYTWSEDPTSLHSHRESQAFRSTRGPMPGKRENFMAWVETIDQQLLVTWPIHSGSPRSLGPAAVVSDGAMVGRFRYLLHKIHATEVMVKVWVPQGIPFTPEPLPQLQARFGAAVREVLPPNADLGDIASMIFDHEQGLRLMVSVRRFARPTLVVVAANHGAPIREGLIEGRVLDAISTLSGFAFSSEDIEFRSTLDLRYGCYSLGLRPPLGLIAQRAQTPPRVVQGDHRP